VLVHHYGVPVPTEALQSLTAAAGALLIEDAAQTAGSFAGGQRTGRVREATVLSFGRGKGVTAGAGGALLLSAEFTELAARATGMLRSASGAGSVIFVGKLFAQWALARPAIYRVPASLPFLRLGETVFRPPTAPMAMAPPAARVLRRTLRLADAEANIRRAHADRLRAVQQRVARETMVEIGADATPGWLRLPLLVRPDHVVDARVAARLGVMPTYPISLSALAPLQPSLTARGRFPGAEALRRRLWTLPTHGALTPRDLEALERWIQELRD
jgi:dTDP-4-amino-4,6-dideoxygalactose transaminase